MKHRDSLYYVMLTCTPHGKPVWNIGEELEMLEVNRPGWDVHNPPPYRIVGPYLWEPEVMGAEEAPVNDEAALNDALGEYDLTDYDLTDPATWLDPPDWYRRYALTGEHPG